MSPKRRHEADDDGDHAGKASKGDLGTRKATFKAFLTALNTQFSSWVQDQKSSHPSDLWLDGVKDYINHAEELLADFKDVLDAEKQQGTGKKVSFGFGASNGDNASAPAAFGASANKDAPSSTFGGAASQPAETTSSAGAFSFGGAAAASAPATTSSFAFGGSSNATTTTAAPASTSAPFAFGGKPAGDAAGAAAPFSFGGAAASNPSSTAAPGGFFNFSGSAAAGSSGAAPFSFGGAPAGGSTGTGAAAGGEEEGEEEAPQKFESEIVTNEEAGTVHFKVKAKMMHYKKSDEGKAAWDTKGVGLVQLRTRTEDASKPFVTFTTEAGRVLYIASIPKAMTVIVNDAKNMLSWSAPWSPDGSAAPTLQMVGMVLPKGKHTELKNEIEKLQAGMP